jgi:hypothetical protein
MRGPAGTVRIAWSIINPIGRKASGMSAFRSAKEFLESHGYEVTVYGAANNRIG